MCDDCVMFRPLEMYKNILHNPDKVTDEEIEALKQRREKEKQMVLERDQESLNNNLSDEQYWYIISSDWLY